jgi:hypothetical protein
MEIEMKEQPGSPWAGKSESAARVHQPGPVEEARRPDPRLDDYLDQVYAPLVGVVPYAKRQELRAELRGHLEALVSGYQELEPDPGAAVPAALRQFGDPRRLARRLARAWAPEKSASVWRATLTALALFGPAAGLGLASLFWWDMAEALETGPFPMGGLGVECLKVALVSPLIAGLVTGLLAPARAALGTFYALALLIVPSVLLSRYGRIPQLDYHLQCGTFLAVVQALAWIPLGCGAAWLGGFLQGRKLLSPGRWVVQ